MVLVIALMTMTVLGIVTGTAIYYTTQSQGQSNYSKASDAAYRLAESGINNAMSTLGYNQTNALSTTALPNTQATASSQSYPTGTSQWWGTLNTGTKTWTLYGLGTVTNPNPSVTTPVTRLLTATMQVTYSYNQPVNTQAWNYIYMTNKGGSNVCDVTLSNNAQIDAPVYVEGNLCFSNNTNIRQDITPSIPISVIVKGKVQWANNGSSIGISTTNYIDSAYIGGGCGSALNSVHTCKAYPTSSSGYDPIYVRCAACFSTSPPTVAPPAVDWTNDGYYASSSPGPTHPCTTTSGTPPSFESAAAPNNTIQNITAPNYNGSIASNQNITPAASYTCKTSAGELSWNATTKTMTISGVVYIDGSVTIGDGGIDEYNGQGVLYTSGTITVSGKMCGKRNAGLTDCDFSSWNPNTEMWILAAHGADASNNSIIFPNSSGDKWEGGVYANNNLSMANNATIEGPMIAGGTDFSNNVTIKPFPVITTVPTGTPGNPNTYAQPNPPGGYSG